jgi:hypothetical protein
MDTLAELRAVSPHTAALAAAIREACGDDDAAFVDTLDGSSTVIDAARAAIRFIAEAEANEAAVKALAQRYSERAKVFSDRVARTRDAIANFMAEIGEKKLALPEATLSLSNGTPSLVGDPDPALLPDSMVRVKREPDRTAIKAALLEGQLVQGCSLSNAAPKLTIRVR